MRVTVVAASLAFILGLAAPAAHGQDSSLPDIGSSAGELLSPEEEVRYGAYMLYELRRAGYVLEDPLLDEWMQTLGHRLAAASVGPTQQC